MKKNEFSVLNDAIAGELKELKAQGVEFIFLSVPPKDDPNITGFYQYVAGSRRGLIDCIAHACREDSDMKSIIDAGLEFSKVPAHIINIAAAFADFMMQDEKPAAGSDAEKTSAGSDAQPK